MSRSSLNPMKYSLTQRSLHGSMLALLAAGLMTQIAVGNTLADSPSWVTNWPSIYSVTRLAPENRSTNGNNLVDKTPLTNTFHHFVAETLNNIVWTNFIAHTNGRTTAIWTARRHSEGWPATPPLAVWDKKGLMWGMRGLTGVSPCWTAEGYPGQVPVTALTKRHGYARGHSMGGNGFNTNFAGHKVWFLTTNNVVVEVKVLRDVVRGWADSKTDYTILLFDRDLPDSIQPPRVVAKEDLVARYLPSPGAPQPFFQTEQSGHVNAMVPGFRVDSRKGGDSGSPNFIPLPGELVFFGGTSCYGPSKKMQADMDELCRLEKLAPSRYQMRWADLSRYASHP